MGTTAFDPATFKVQQRQMWDASAPGWWESRGITEAAGQHLNERMVQLAHIGPGSRVLDVGTGLGEPGLSAARAAAPNGTVVGVDISPRSLEFARRRAESLGIGNITFVEGDAEHLGYAAGSFDAILSRWVIMQFPDLIPSLVAWRDMLAPAGRLVVAVWGRADETPLMSAPLGALARSLGGLPPSPLDPFALGDPDVLRAHIWQAGFSLVEIEKTQVVYTFESAEAYVASQLASNPMLAGIIRQQPEEARPRLMASVRASAAPFTDGTGTVRVPNATLIATAQR